MPEVCRSCKAPTLLARTINGSLMPMDAEPVEATEWRRGLFTMENGVVSSWKKADPRPAGPLYQSHFASCPDADHWRKT